MLKHHQWHIHIWEVALTIPHSYLVHFELVQTCCLSSYAMHTLYFDHTRTRHQPLSAMNNLTKAHHPPETKRKQESESSCSWILVQVKKRRGTMIRAKVLMTNKCRCLHMLMVKVLEWHGYLETHCLNLQNKWKRWARTSVTIYTRERLRLKRIIHHECPSELSIQEFAFVFKNLKTLQAPRRKARIDFWWQVLMINRWKRRC